MNIAVKRRKLTAEQFLKWAANQEGRYELENGEVIEMSAEKARHALMKHAVTSALQAAITAANLDCAVFPDGMLVVVDGNNVRLPDAVVQCAPFDPDDIRLDSPVILVEVTSPSSVYRDERHKLIEYFQIPSVIHYLLLTPDQRVVVHFKRGGEPGKIETTIMTEGRIDLTPPGLIVDVEDMLGKLPPNATIRS